MSGFTPKQNAYWLAAVTLTLLTIDARSAGDVKFSEGYRSWRHVNTMIVTKDSPLFEGIGGGDNIYVKPAGGGALGTKGPYPNKTSFVSDPPQFTFEGGGDFGR